MAEHHALSLGTTGPGTPVAAIQRDLPGTQQREKGLWNFLTWSFFISQIMVAEQFLGSAAKAGEVVAHEALPASDAAAAQAVIGSLQAEGRLGGGIEETAQDATSHMLPPDAGPTLVPQLLAH